jgi:predicted DCC family thiol-disulfide oxidoreductase YuxK
MTTGNSVNPPKLTVVYDGQCNLCLATVDRLKQLPSRAKLSFIPLQKIASGEIAPWPGISEVPYGQLVSQMHVTDERGHRYSGHEGVLLLLRHVPSLAWLGWLGGLPGLRGIARLLYRTAARYRYQLFGKTDCSDGVCRIPQVTNQTDGGEKH